MGSLFSSSLPDASVARDRIAAQLDEKKQKQEAAQEAWAAGARERDRKCQLEHDTMEHKRIVRNSNQCRDAILEAMYKQNSLKVDCPVETGWVSDIAFTKEFLDELETKGYTCHCNNWYDGGEYTPDICLGYTIKWGKK